MSLATAVPFLGAPLRPVVIRGLETDDRATLRAPVVGVSWNYFDTLELALARGRRFNRADGVQEKDVAVVNQLFVDRYLAGHDPIGRQIRVGVAAAEGATASDRQAELSTEPWLTVVGIAPTIRQGVAQGPRPLVYVPYFNAPDSSAHVIVRMPTAPSSTIVSIRARLADLDPDLLLTDVRPLADSLRNSRLQPQLIASVLGSLGLIALFLSAVGLYAITAHGVRQRTTEIGLRLALGGRPAQIIWLFMRRGMAPIAAGLVVGLGGALGVGQLLRGLLIGTTATDPATFIELSLLLTAVTLTACFVPARRGARVDPAATLRQD
jgi:putative ABC transport system permease protein